MQAGPQGRQITSFADVAWNNTQPMNVHAVVNEIYTGILK